MTGWLNLSLLNPHPLWSNPSPQLIFTLRCASYDNYRSHFSLGYKTLGSEFGPGLLVMTMCGVMSRYVTRWPGNVTSPASHSPSGIRGEYYELWLNSKAEDCVIWTILSTDVRISAPVQVRQSARHLDREVWIPLGAGTGRILTNSTECNSSQQFSATHWRGMSHNVLMNKQACEISIAKILQYL